MLENLSLLVAFLVSLPLLVVALQCLAALLLNQPNYGDVVCAETKKVSFLIPAHNEAGIIEKTLSHLMPELPDGDTRNVVLIADNCSDDTAQIARSFGVTVIERQHATERGKGFALDFGLQHLKATTPPEIVIILDADCETTKADLSRLIATVATRHLPAQMIYLMRVIKGASIKQKIAGFAWLLKNKVRLLGMNALGLPVVLTGTGMAFPWTVFEKVRLGSGNIVEDMQLGIDCSVIGFPPVLSADATVYSDFPEQSAAELSQRTRWEHGHLQTIAQQVPALIKQAWSKKSPGLLVLAFDIGVPPLSLLVMLAFGGLGLLGLIATLTSATVAVKLLMVSFGLFAVMLIAVWWRYGQDYLSAKELLGIPFYILSKLSIYAAFIFKRQKDWVRTERDS
jgi:cellulose synthase/poly-beta-1,6-N-acetylglucosamine synthase-like glycosyltransferase